jgi:hypothetical protein
MDLLPQQPEPPPQNHQLNAQRKIWLLTYSPPDRYITIEMLKELENLEADECHSTSDRVMVYTYIHLTKRIRQAALERFMEKAKYRYGVTKNEIFGYDAIAYEDGRDDTVPMRSHVAFVMLVTHANAGNPAFKPFTDGEPVLKRGMIFKATHIQHDQIALEYQTKSQLIEYISKLKEEQEEAKQQKSQLIALNQFYQAATDEVSRLRVETAMQSRTIQLLEDQLRAKS